MTIPANQISSVAPGVLTTGGNPLSLNGLIVTDSSLLAVGPPTSFATASEVGIFFGLESEEYAMACAYFAGYEGAKSFPSALLFVRYDDGAADASAFMNSVVAQNANWAVFVTSFSPTHAFSPTLPSSVSTLTVSETMFPFTLAIAADASIYVTDHSQDYSHNHIQHVQESGSATPLNTAFVGLVTGSLLGVADIVYAAEYYYDVWHDVWHNVWPPLPAYSTRLWKYVNGAMEALGPEQLSGCLVTCFKPSPSAAGDMLAVVGKYWYGPPDLRASLTILDAEGRTRITCLHDYSGTVGDPTEIDVIAAAPNGDLYFAGSNGTAIRVGVKGAGPVFLGPAYDYPANVTDCAVVAGVLHTPGTNDGIGTAARFADIRGLCFDADSNLYICDGSAIRRMAPDGTVTTLAGSILSAGFVDGSSSVARFGHPTDVAVLPDGRLIVADYGNTALRIVMPEASTKPTKKSLSQWASAQGGRYVYACWDDDTAALAAPTGATFGEWLRTADVSNVCAVYGAQELAAFVAGIAASIDYAAQNGKLTFAFKRSTGMAYINDSAQAANLLANGYNFYGNYATANDSFPMLYDGRVSGDFTFLDTQIDAIWLENQIQSSLFTLFKNSPSVGYDSKGLGMIAATVQGVMAQAATFGMVEKDAVLSAAQISEVNLDAGAKIAGALASKGWYFQIVQPAAYIRALRQSPHCRLWYVSGGAIQKLSVSSIVVR